jgi:arylsulfatase A
MIASLLLATVALTPPPPNIVLILADDLGYGDLGSYGQRWIQTPNLDRLAREGMRFTQFYSGSTVCAPARDSLLTGRTTGHSWMRGNGQIALRPDPEDVTVATLLQRAGYHTASIGKSSVQCDSDDPSVPHTKGFDDFFGQLRHIDAHFHWPKHLTRNGERVEYPNNTGHEGDTYDHAEYLREAREFLDRRPPRQPFFLMYSATIPHAGITVEPWFKRPYNGKFPEIPFAGGHYNAVEDPSATYAGMVSRLDYEVGEIVRKLKAKGLDRNTLVLFMSDNGGMQEGGYRAEYLDSNGGLRGTKRDLYEGGIRVPLIAWWPGTVPSGRTVDQVAAFWDVLPTLTDLASVRAPSGIQGISFAPTLLGRPGQRSHTNLYWEFHEGGGKRAVRFGDWKAVQVNVGSAPHGPVELYHLPTDPAESTDLASKRPELVERARQLFETSRSEHPIFRFGASHDPQSGCCGT